MYLFAITAILFSSSKCKNLQNQKLGFAVETHRKLSGHIWGEFMNNIC